MKKIEMYTTHVAIFDYKNFEERNSHINKMKELGYFSRIAELNPTRVTYTKIFSENHKSL